MFRMSSHRMTRAFSSESLRPGAHGMGHVLNIDHFQMSEPTFPPHPHAGFSAVTYMLPWSAGGFINRDSHGDRSLISPGALHWTLAGSGMMHEEIPEVPGTRCEGLQIFVKLPEPLELSEPRAFHVGSSEVPTARFDGGHARVLVGRFAGVEAPIPSYAEVTMAHVQVDGRVRLQVPPRLHAFGVVLRGRGRVQGEAAEVHHAFAAAPPMLSVEGEGLHILIAWSEPMARTPTFRGPFCMFRPERLAQAAIDVATGKMGQLVPSPVAWVR